MAPAYSALLCAPLGFSEPHTRALGGFSELLTIFRVFLIAESTEKSPIARIWEVAEKHEKAEGALRYALIGAQEPHKIGGRSARRQEP